MLITIGLRLIPVRREYWNGLRLKLAYMGGWRVQAELMGYQQGSGAKWQPQGTTPGLEAGVGVA